MNIDRDLIAASVTPLLLSLLEQEESYGYRLIQRVKQCSDGALEWSEGMLYPVLHRLEKRGLIISHWKTADNGRRRKYYALTEKGRLELERQKREWHVVASALRRSGFPVPLEASLGQ
ncbi:MAG TPA: helix-turn-helix transcriptional regulator [Limnochordales bacterium]